MSSTIELGTVETLYRYPIKAILGETLDAVEVGERGFVGDRRYAIHHGDGTIGSHKHSRRMRPMRGLFELKGRFVQDDLVEVTFPDGSTCMSDDKEIHARLTVFAGSDAHLRSARHRPFFDVAPIHIVDTASLEALQTRLPNSEVDARRFRPNIVIKTAHDAPPEEKWLGGILAIGDVRLLLTEPTGRCIMTTLPQENLSEDSNILLTLKHRQKGRFGIYADVLGGGEICTGLPVQLETL